MVADPGAVRAEEHVLCLGVSTDVQEPGIANYRDDETGGGQVDAGRTRQGMASRVEGGGTGGGSQGGSQGGSRQGARRGARRLDPGIGEALRASSDGGPSTRGVARLLREVSGSVIGGRCGNSPWGSGARPSSSPFREEEGLICV